MQWMLRCLTYFVCFTLGFTLAQQPLPNPNNQLPAPFSSQWWCDVFRGAESKVVDSKTHTQIAVGLGGWSDIPNTSPISASLHFRHKSLDQIQRTGRCSGYSAPPDAEGWSIGAGLSTNLDWYVGYQKILWHFEISNWYGDVRFGWGLNRFMLGAILDAPILLYVAPGILIQLGFSLGYQQPTHEGQALFAELDLSLSMLSSVLTAKVGLRF